MTSAIKNFKFPLQQSREMGYFQLTETSLETVKQNLLLFFATDESERVVRNELGSRFRKYLFEPDIQSIRLKCESEVSRIFSQYFPQLNLEQLQIEVVPDNNISSGTIKINVSYSFKSFEAINDSLTVVLG